MGRDPVLLQLNTSVLLNELGAALRRTATLEDVPDRYLDFLRETGFDTIYLLGVWSVGAAGLKAAQDLMKKEKVPQGEISSSPFAITGYHVRPEFGGDAALKKFRERLHSRNMRLIVDFVPNHVAIDHPWVSTKPELIMQGTDDLMRRESANFFRSNGRIFAHGKDPHFAGWTDTAQLNYFSKELRDQMRSVLHQIAELADGVRCDMAMLVCTQIFQKTWGHVLHQTSKADPKQFEQFWKESIQDVHSKFPNFTFIAEVYWSMEKELIDHGFDFCYDKDLYDAFKDQQTGRINQSLHAKHQHHLARFLENHDEERAAAVYGNDDQHRAAAVICFLSPGLKFFHMGQFEGRRMKVPMQRNRYLEEHGMEGPQATEIYAGLLNLLKHSAANHGEFQVASVRPSGHEEEAKAACAGIVSFFWWSTASKGTEEFTIPSGRPLMVVVNYADKDSHGRIRVPHAALDAASKGPALNGRIDSFLGEGHGKKETVLLWDVFGRGKDCCFRRHVEELRNEGMWFFLRPWEVNVLEVQRL